MTGALAAGANKEERMKTYAVGGAIRDELMGLPVKDRDWVVVGATPGDMIRRGFRPVGRDFPVFLHPDTHEEYALARTERKTAPGYGGFIFHTDPGVSLEEDLRRRDLTINAIAQDEHGELTDPHNGRADIAAKVLRHVSPAFAEDPVRILRIARFAARFKDFTVAPETMALMRQMVEDGEVDALVSERVWQELVKGLLEETPSRMLAVLHESGALRRILPEVDALYGVPQRAEYHPEIDTGTHIEMVLDMTARVDAPLPVRFAALTHDIGKSVTPVDLLPSHHGHGAASVRLLDPLCARLRVPSECRELAVLVARYHGDIHRAAELRPETMVKIIEHADGVRRPDRFMQALLACECDARGRTGHDDDDYPQAQRFLSALTAVRAVDAGAIAKACTDPAQIPQRVHEARVAAVTALWQ
jgi:tRNA nucleotidyltransferase (CCA-adding enzyme)